MTEGWRQDRKPNPYFDPLYYAQVNDDVDFPASILSRIT